MVQLHIIQISEIVVPADRQRRAFSPEDLTKLASSISQNGLIHPIVVRRSPEGEVLLVAGERRLRAMVYAWNFGQKVRCGEQMFKEGEVPCLYQGELDPIAAYEMELEENIRRVGLTWQEESVAVAKLFELRTLQAHRDGTPEPTVGGISAEIQGYPPTIRQKLLLHEHLDDPDIQKAKTADEGFKILKRKESLKRNEALAKQIGVTFNSSLHQLEQGDCIEVMQRLPDGTFDVILTDPPYGIDADKFNDSGGTGGATGNHFYDDSWTTWNRLMQACSTEWFRLAKPQSHSYIFCDIDNFVMLKSFMTEAGWKVFRTPLIWINPAGARAPWPEHGPQRKYQLILYAIKGNRPALKLFPDVITCSADANLGHQAQKPVSLYVELLQRSVIPGDMVLDSFMGTGTILPAAHLLKCRATGIEIDPAAYGMAINRLKEIK